jgi:hypothetical protein
VLTDPSIDATHKFNQLIRSGFPFHGDTVEQPQVSADEWSAIAQIAREHRLAPLLYASLLQSDNRNRPPGEIDELLQTAYHETKISNWLAFQELEQVLTQCERAHIPVILLKGAALANTVYHRIALRTMGDLDLLIHRVDLSRVGEILAARDFTRYRELAEDFDLRFAHHRVFDRYGERPLTIEAHWHLFNRPYYRNRIPIAWFWQRTIPIRLNGRTALAFAPEAQIVHLATHAVLHHQGHDLQAAYDLALVLDHYRDQIHWAEVIEFVNAFGLSYILQYNLERVRDTWGVAVPSDVYRHLAQSYGVGELILFAVNTASALKARDLWDGMNLPGLKPKLLYFSTKLFPSREYIRQQYGIFDTRILPFLYLRRLTKGTERFVRSVVAIGKNEWKVLRHPSKEKT